MSAVQLALQYVSHSKNNASIIHLFKLGKTLYAFLTDKCPRVPKLDVLNHCTAKFIKHPFTQVRESTTNNQSEPLKHPRDKKMELKYQWTDVYIIIAFDDLL